jgi:ABC-type Na+ efflux pump permease subunit
LSAATRCGLLRSGYFGVDDELQRFSYRATRRHEDVRQLAVVVSFVPPLSSFGMLLRLASSSPPPTWQVWLSIAIGVAGVFGAVWVTAKVFRIGILMFGRPPDFKTLVRWLRAA